MYQETGTVPDNFLSQQTLSEIIMVMCDDDGGEGKGGRRGRKKTKQLFLMTPHSQQSRLHCP